MEPELETQPKKKSTLPGGRRAVAIASVAGALVVGGIGAAVAQTGGSTPTTQPPAANGAPGIPGGPGGPGGGHGFDGPRGGPGHRNMMGGPMGAIHGEFVVPNGSNAYRTIDTQRGEVTDVDSNSITLKSADGFSKSYGVDQNTVVDSGRDGIGNVKKGDTVRLVAAVSDGKASAMSVDDETTLGSIRQHWNPEAPAAPNTGQTPAPGQT